MRSGSVGARLHDELVSDTATTDLPRTCAKPGCGQKLMLLSPGRDVCERCRLGRTVMPKTEAEIQAEAEAVARDIPIRDRCRAAIGTPPMRGTSSAWPTATASPTGCSANTPPADRQKLERRRGQPSGWLPSCGDRVFAGRNCSKNSRGLGRPSL